MYPTLLALHSVVRWLVLASLIFTLLRSVYGWCFDREFTRLDNSLRHWTATIAHIQLLLGTGLYLLSPLVAYFLRHFNEAIHERELRFFGMEHSLMMLSAIILITVGSALAKRKTTDREKFRTMAIWFGISFLMIMSSVPWAFSPFTSRPYFRPF